MNRTLFEPGTLAEIDLRFESRGWTLIWVRDLSHPPEAVWTVLTEPTLLRRWTSYTPDRNLGSTGPAIVTIAGVEEECLEAMVTHAEPASLLECAWSGDRLRWELSPVGRGTRVTLRHTFAGWDWAAEVAAGWHLSFEAAERLLRSSSSVVGGESSGVGGESSGVGGESSGVGGEPCGRTCTYADLQDAYAQLLLFAGRLDVDGDNWWPGT